MQVTFNLDNLRTKEQITIHSYIRPVANKMFSPDLARDLGKENVDLEVVTSEEELLGKVL